MGKGLRKKLDISSTELEIFLSKNSAYRENILNICRYLSGASIGIFVKKSDLLDIEQMTDYDVKATLELYCDNGFLEEKDGYFCPHDESQAEYDDEKDVYYCDICTTSIPKQDIDIVQGYLTLKNITYPKKEFEDFRDFDYGEFKNRLLKGVPRFIHSLKKVHPVFLCDYLEKKYKADEGHFRDEMLRSLSFVFDSEGEAIRGKGRSDLIIQGVPGDLERVVGEFKVWPRNDYKETLDQLLEYLSDLDDLGFIFMVNENKSCILDSYKSLILKNATYVEDTLLDNPILNNKSMKHFLTYHQRGEQTITVFHFIFDVFPINERKPEGKVPAKAAAKATLLTAGPKKLRNR